MPKTKNDPTIEEWSMNSLLAHAMLASRRGDKEEEKRLRSQVALIRLHRFLEDAQPIIAEHGDIARAILDQHIESDR